MIKKLVSSQSEGHPLIGQDDAGRRCSLVEPHGGTLIDRLDLDFEVQECRALPRIQVTVADLMNV